MAPTDIYQIFLRGCLRPRRSGGAVRECSVLSLSGRDRNLYKYVLIIFEVVYGMGYIC